MIPFKIPAHLGQDNIVLITGKHFYLYSVVFHRTVTCEIGMCHSTKEDKNYFVKI